MKYFPLLVLFVCCTWSQSALAQDMNNGKIAKLLKEKVTKIEGKKGNWHFEYKKAALFIITDERANRMRIYAPIIEEAKLKEADLKLLLEANWHSALDAKYALAGGYLVSIYNHPLQELSAAQLSNAIDQVTNLVLTYGTSYNSTGLVFPGGESEQSIKKGTKM